MKIERIELYHIELPLIHPFETSFGRITTRPSLLVASYAEGIVGWGECSAMAQPVYSYETTETAWHMLSDFLIPAVLGNNIREADEIAPRFRRIRGHPMAWAALENSVWDVLAQAQAQSLATMLGGTRTTVAVGVSVGIEPTLALLLEQVAQFVAQGYQRVKLKIKPGWDVAVVRAVRERYPELLLHVDANSSYTLHDIAIMRELDTYGLLMIEQPLHYEDIVDHSLLQSQLHTPICLDETIHSPEHARWALDIDACRIINIKVGRVGGLHAARDIHNLCHKRGVPVWCGGMLETNVGRATNIALASLPNFTMHGDISASNRYYEQDIAEPNFVLTANSSITVPTKPGIGVQVNAKQLARWCVRSQTFTLPSETTVARD